MIIGGGGRRSLTRSPWRAPATTGGIDGGGHRPRQRSRTRRVRVGVVKGRERTVAVDREHQHLPRALIRQINVREIPVGVAHRQLLQMSIAVGNLKTVSLEDYRAIAEALDGP